MVLPGFGMISEILPVFARKPLFGYKAIAASTLVIAFLGLLVWAHHMFSTPSPQIVLVFFMLSSMLISIPTGVKIFNWIATLWSGTIVFRTPLLFAVGFLGTFLIGGITGVFLAIYPVDWQLHDTYFVVAHFHYVLMGRPVFAVMAGRLLLVPEDVGPDALRGPSASGASGSSSSASTPPSSCSTRSGSTACRAGSRSTPTSATWRSTT